MASRFCLFNQPPAALVPRLAAAFLRRRLVAKTRWVMRGFQAGERLKDDGCRNSWKLECHRRSPLQFFTAARGIQSAQEIKPPARFRTVLVTLAAGALLRSQLHHFTVAREQAAGAGAMKHRPLFRYPE